jgi:drug/metabolite transporter (DMT)-like permease
MPLADATTIGFTSPVLTVLLAAALLGERLRWSAMLALLLAFAGTIVVLRPSFAALGPAALLPLVAAAGMSLLMIGNRKVAGTGSTLAMQFAVAQRRSP